MEDSSMTLCGHRFCTKCIKEWIKRKQNCPQCNQSVTANSLIEDKSFKEIKTKDRLFKRINRNKIFQNLKIKTYYVYSGLLIKLHDLIFDSVMTDPHFNYV
jgi:uncharacterized membrane protein YvbJ